MTVKRVHDAVYWRVIYKRSSRSLKLYLMAADFEKTKDPELLAVDQAVISAVEYIIDDKG